MGNTSASKGRFALLAIACALVCACALIIAPGRAMAINLMAGEQVVSGSEAPTISSAVSGSAGELTVMISRAYSDTEAVECQVALDAGFTNQVKSDASASLVKQFAGLKQGKTYYVRARECMSYNGQLYFTTWSDTVKAKVAISNAKSKIKGTWKIVKSTDPSTNSRIQHNKRISKKLKATLTFSKNGTIVLKDYDKKKYKLSSSWGKWAALSNTSGQTVYEGIKIGSIKVKGKTLTIQLGKVKYTCKK